MPYGIKGQGAPGGLEVLKVSRNQCKINEVRLDLFLVNFVVIVTSLHELEGQPVARLARLIVPGQPQHDIVRGKQS